MVEDVGVGVDGWVGGLVGLYALRRKIFRRKQFSPRKTPQK